MGKWIKRKLPDYILCLCAALGLIMPIIRGFCVPDRLIGQPGWALLASALFLLALFLFSYRRLTILIGVCVGVVAAVMAILSVRRSGLSLVDPARQEENVLLWVIVVFLCVLLVFLLSRTKGSAAILLVLGVLCCTLSAFLQYSNALGYLLLFLIGSGGGLLYAGYRRAVLEYHTAKVAAWRAVAIATLFCVICLSISSAAWFLIVRPIDPPTQDLKLIQYLLSLEELERIGISSKLPIEGDQTAQQTEQSDKLEHTTPTSTPQPPTPTPQEQAPQLNMRPQDEVGGEEIRYPTPPGGFVLWISIWIAAAIVLLIAGKMYQRRAWRRKLRTRPPLEQVCTLYPWYRTQLAKLGIVGKPADTPDEWAQTQAHRMVPFETSGVTWQQLSAIYSAAYFGALEPTQAQVDAFWLFDSTFYRACRKHIGTPAYLRIFFRI